MTAHPNRTARARRGGPKNESGRLAPAAHLAAGKIAVSPGEDLSLHIGGFATVLEREEGAAADAFFYGSVRPRFSGPRRNGPAQVTVVVSPAGSG
jgi:hypothetical protein